jgi:formylglycine-generating enzyme required for sulfatase activity
VDASAADDSPSPVDGNRASDSTQVADTSGDQSSADGGPCTANATRCGVTGGREVCQNSQWQASACPVNQATCAAGQCTVRGPTMVQVASSFYIDSTEVTSAQYQIFLTANGTDTSGQPSVCAWNTTYQPAAALNAATDPVTNVDWCDALAYCTWAGKHLCGAIGGGPIAIADALMATKSQWFLACGGPGGSSHPNGTSVCNSTGGTTDLAPVATFPGCEGFYSGVYDLEGNAAEWVDSCDSNDAGATDTCHSLGGSFYDNQSYCTESYDWPRNKTQYGQGFRCCAG